MSKTKRVRLNRSSGPSLSPNKAIRFRLTDEMGVLLRELLRSYYAERKIPISQRDLRRMKSKLFVAMSEGARRISVAKVARR